MLKSLSFVGVQQRKIRVKYINHFSSCLRSTSSQSGDTPSHTKELKIPIPYGHLAAKTLGSSNNFPVLTLHGWMDNCGTFDKLIPLLSEKYYFVALDLPGHGLSSHRPEGCFYSYFDMIIDLKRVFSFFSWDKAHVVGHSMGGEIALLYASIFPKAIAKLVLLDVVKPYFCLMDKLPENAATSIEGNLSVENKLMQPSPEYSPEAALKRLVDGMYNEITTDCAALLLKRGAKPCPSGKVTFTRDLRIKNIEPYNVISHKAAQVFVSRMECELLILPAKNPGDRFKSLYPEEDKLFIDVYKKHCKRLIMEKVEGNHFVHLNDPIRVAPVINAFFDT